MVNKSVNCWTCQHYFYASIELKLIRNENRSIFVGLFWLWLIGFGLVYSVGVNEQENQSSREKLFQSNIYYSMSVKVYIVFIQEIWVQIYGYFWVQSLCLLTHASKVYAVWVHVHGSVGCKVCGCWVHVYGYYWVHVCGFWVHVMDRLGACMQLLGAKYAVVGCMPDSR